MRQFAFSFILHPQICISQLTAQFGQSLKQTYPTCGTFCKTPVFVSVKSQCLAGGRWGEEFLDLKETKETTLEKEMAAHPLQCSCLGNPMD